VTADSSRNYTPSGSRCWTPWFGTSARCWILYPGYSADTPFLLSQRQTVTSRAAVRIVRVSLYLQNREFSGVRAHGALFARAIGVDLKYWIGQHWVAVSTGRGRRAHPRTWYPHFLGVWVAQPVRQVGNPSGSASAAAAAAI